MLCPIHAIGEKMDRGRINEIYCPFDLPGNFKGVSNLQNFGK